MHPGEPVPWEVLTHGVAEWLMWVEAAKTPVAIRKIDDALVRHEAAIAAMN